MPRLRFWLSPSLEVEGGHTGYDVRASARGKGFGALALRLASVEAKRRGLDRARLTADADNHPSLKIIEKCGGVLSGEAISEQRKADQAGLDRAAGVVAATYRFGTSAGSVAAWLSGEEMLHEANWMTKNCGKQAAGS